MGGWEGYVGPGMGPGFGFLAGLGFIGFLIALIWSIYWKGMALWHSARRGEKVWFVVLLVVNTVGILEILYLYVFSNKAKSIE
ncbi:MAG TPA: DUF5652 family protein [Candidatus Paceibacterota bacterium]|nr:DUF5652 family protein [Candidatus Paceibacterota bacterium]